VWCTRLAIRFNGRKAGSYTVYVRDAKGCVITRTQTLTAPGGITATTGWTDETACNAADGTITVTGVTGATGPFAYFRGSVSDADGVFTDLTPGTYTIRVVAQNCEYTTTVTVGTACTNPPMCTLAANSSKTDPTCANPNGGLITLTVSGGTAPYQYAVNSPNFIPGTGMFDNLPAGNYNITVQDNAGCTFSLNTITLTAPAVPAAPRSLQPGPGLPRRNPAYAYRNGYRHPVVRQQQPTRGICQRFHAGDQQSGPGNVQLFRHADGQRLREC
jgi:hypothetical protein